MVLSGILSKFVRILKAVEESKPKEEVRAEESKATEEVKAEESKAE